MKYNFDEIIPRHNTGSLKYDDCMSIYGASDLLPMWIADMDFKTPDCIVDALKKRLEHPIFGYFNHSKEFYESIISWMQKRHQWQVEKDWITFAPTVVTALATLIQTFTKSGDKILVQPPVYYPFFTVVKNQNRTIVENPLKLEGDLYKMDFFDMENKLKTGVAMMILCNPHNPVGRCWQPEELQKVAELCLKYNTLLISYEIHSDLIMRGYRHTVVASLSSAIAENTITCMSPSKTFNLAGMTTSEVLISNEKLRSRYQDLMNNHHFLCVGNIFGELALQTAYLQGEEWLEQLLDYLTSNVQFTKELLAAKCPEITTYQHEATYVLWVNFKNFGMCHEHLREKLIKNAKLALNDGTIFGTGGECHFRMNLACPKSTIQEAVNRLSDVF